MEGWVGVAGQAEQGWAGLGWAGGVALEWPEALTCVEGWCGVQGTGKDLELAAEAYLRAKGKRSAQAMFNLAFMHQQGLGMPKDLFLAKRYYDEALAADSDAALPVTLALTGLWWRQQHPESVGVRGEGGGEVLFGCVRVGGVPWEWEGVVVWGSFGGGGEEKCAI